MTETLAPSPRPSRKKLLAGSAVGLVAAAAALVLFVLPAEFGIDPTGAGQAMGLVEMAKPENVYLKRGQARQNVMFTLPGGTHPDEAVLRQTLAEKGIALPADARLVGDKWTFDLLPYEGIEFKYELAQGAPMMFAWQGTGPLSFDMHAHPYQGGTEATESYAITEQPSQSAVYIAPFTGIHGWYWRNETLEPATVTLEATGLFTKSVIFDQAGEHPRPLPALAKPAAGQSG